MRGIQIRESFWRESARSVKLGFLNAYVVGPLMLFLLHIRWWTFFLLVATIIAMFVIEQFGYSPPVAALALRARLAGRQVTRRRTVLGVHLDD